MKKVSVVLIPAYQPSQSLLATAHHLISAGYKVVVVDDGSEAIYQSVFEKLDHRVHLIRHSTNQGKGTALKTGLKYIKRTYKNFIVITADADGQHHVEDIKNLARYYLKFPGVLLLGSRTFSASSVPLRSKVGNRITQKIFSLMTRRSINDTQTGLRAFDESLIDFMLTVPGEQFEYEMNVLLNSSRKNVELVERPITTIYSNNNESSHFNPIKDSFSIYIQIIKFASSSLISFGIDYTLFLLLISLTSSWALAASVLFANTVARLVSASVNFTLNRRLVFRNESRLSKSILYYALLCGAILLANTVLLTILTSTAGIAPAVAKIAAELTLFIASYFVQKNVIFDKRRGAHYV